MGLESSRWLTNINISFSVQIAASHVQCQVRIFHAKVIFRFLLLFEMAEGIFLLLLRLLVGILLFIFSQHHVGRVEVGGGLTIVLGQVDETDSRDESGGCGE